LICFRITEQHKMEESRRKEEMKSGNSKKIRKILNTRKRRKALEPPRASALKQIIYGGI
jgi:hypothetical protein